MDDSLGNDIADLVGAMEVADLSSCAIESGEDRLFLRRPSVSMTPSLEPVPEPQATGEKLQEKPEDILRSPRVGHFFPRQGKQAGDPYRPGDRIEAGEVYGTIEAMHLKYELRAERGGVVKEFLAVEGEAVEYGQPLVALMAGQ